MAPRNPKPPPPGKGRIPGSKNKFPSALKEKVLHAVAHLEAQGKDLASVAEKKPEWFYENFVKPMLPKTLEGDLKGNISVRLVMDLGNDADSDGD